LQLRRIGWPVFVIGLIGACAAFAYFVAFPQYREPSARLWATSLGYPAVLRHLGQPIPVSVAPAEKRRMVDVISSVGMMDYLNRVPVNTEVVGIIVNVPVRVGDQVQPGDTLLTVSTGGQEARLAKLDLELKNSIYEKAKADYQRDEKALKSGVISQAVYEATRARYREAEVHMLKAREALESTIRSRTEKVRSTAPNSHSGDRVIGLDLQDRYMSRPVSASAAITPPAKPEQPDLSTELQGFGERIPILALTAGTVIQVNADVGQNLAEPTNRLMFLGDRLVFNASVDQRYYGSLKIGDRAKIYLRAIDAPPLAGSVVRINPIVISDSAALKAGGAAVVPFSFTVAIEIEGTQEKLASGMNGYSLFSREVEKLAVPQAALMRYSGGEGVVGVVDADNRSRFVPVTYSISNDGWIAIEKGLQPGARVILAGQTALRDGDAVRPTSEPGAANRR
jgi:multidrug efflux pump subunit AcrA (membrane-fusion protein)